MKLDKDHIKNRFGKSISTYDQHAIVQREICKELVQMLRQVDNLCYKKVFEVGCGTGLLTREFLSYYKPDCYWLNDLIEETFVTVREILHKQGVNDCCFLQGDAENLYLPESIDLFLSASTMQWFENTAFFLKKIHQNLTEDATIAFSVFGESNYKEIKAIMGTYLNYTTIGELQKDLKYFYDIQMIKEENRILSFSSPIDILRHIKYTGVNGLSRRYWSKRDLNDFSLEYKKRFDGENGVSLTYHPIYVIAKKKNIGHKE